MSNSQAMATSFLGQLLTGTHNFGSSPTRAGATADSFKAALFLASGTRNAASTTYSVTDEVSGAGYTAGGIAVTNASAPSATNSSATAGVGYWTPSASLVYTTVTLATAFDAVMIYNSTQGDKTVSVHTFGSQTVTAGTFTLTMPTNDTAAALLRLATT